MSFLNIKEILEFAKLVLVSLLIVVPIRLYVAQPFIVRGDSMDPTFYNGDYLVIDEITYRFQEPQRGEVVVFRYPQDTSKFFIKRVIGLPGEKIVIQGGRVTVINDEHPEGLLLQENYTYGQTVPDTEKQLGPNEYYVLGDNRPFSSDSRYWGPLADEYIIGRAIVRLLPVTSASVWPGYNVGALDYAVSK